MCLVPSVAVAVVATRPAHIFTPLLPPVRATLPPSRLARHTMQRPSCDFASLLSCVQRPTCPPAAQVIPCNKSYPHDWERCPYAHRSEGARRRDPRRYPHAGVACPRLKQARAAAALAQRRARQGRRALQGGDRRALPHLAACSQAPIEVRPRHKPLFLRARIHSLWCRTGAVPLATPAPMPTASLSIGCTPAGGAARGSQLALLGTLRLYLPPGNASKSRRRARALRRGQPPG